ncbi:MAG: hypothetical protein AB7U20_12565 [Planctomycetaceae bacterium]
MASTPLKTEWKDAPNGPPPHAGPAAGGKKKSELRAARLGRKHDPKGI